MSMYKDNKGFSLVEMIVVMTIMAALMGIFAPIYLQYVGRSRRATDVTTAKRVVDVLDRLFTVEKIDEIAGAYPTSKTWDKSTSMSGSDVFAKMYSEFGEVPLAQSGIDYKWHVVCGTDVNGFWRVKRLYLIENDGDTTGYELYPDADKFIEKNEKVTIVH